MENFNYDELYKSIVEMNKSTKEKCLICHFVIDEKEIELNCKHQYHFNCINSIKSCPYCGKIIKSKNKPEVNTTCKFKMLSGIKKGELCNRVNCGYHKNYNNKTPINNENAIEYPELSKSIIKTGIKKGQQCGRAYCNYHNINP
jgi:hypothetical protein